MALACNSRTQEDGLEFEASVSYKFQISLGHRTSASLNNNQEGKCSLTLPSSFSEANINPCGKVSVLYLEGKIALVSTNTQKLNTQMAWLTL